MSNSIQPFADECSIDGCEYKRFKPNKGQVYKHCRMHHDILIMGIISKKCSIDHCEKVPLKWDIVCKKHRERIDKGLPMWLPEEYCHAPGCQSIATDAEHGFCLPHSRNPEYISFLEILEPITEYEIPYEVITCYEA